MTTQNSGAKKKSAQKIYNANKQLSLTVFSFPLPENESDKEELIFSQDTRTGGK